MEKAMTDSIARVESYLAGGRERIFHVAVCGFSIDLDSCDESRAKSICRKINTAASLRESQAVKSAVKAFAENAAKKLCSYCDMGWKFEVKDGGVYHFVPPKNAPTTYLNKKCRAAEIRKMAESEGV